MIDECQIDTAIPNKFIRFVCYFLPAKRPLNIIDANEDAFTKRCQCHVKLILRIDDDKQSNVAILKHRRLIAVYSSIQWNARQWVFYTRQTDCSQCSDCKSAFNGWTARDLNVPQCVAPTGCCCRGIADSCSSSSGGGGWNASSWWCIASQHRLPATYPAELGPQLPLHVMICCK